MKTFLTSLLVALTCCGNAQTFTDLQDSAYILLNKNRITTEALANRAFPWVDLTIPKTSEDTLKYSFLAQAWQQPVPVIQSRAERRKRNEYLSKSCFGYMAGEFVFSQRQTNVLFAL